MKKINVMIFPAGAENAMEIYYAIKENVNIEVYGASGKSDHAKFIYDQSHYFEDDFYITAKDFIPKFRSLLVENCIDVLIPTHDTIALYFAEHALEFPVKVLTATQDTALICREKQRTFQLFESYDFCPKVYSNASFIQEGEFPVFVKPNIGEGGKGAFLASTEAQLDGIDPKQMVFCEYLPGLEYTVDCFTNRHGNLTFVGMRTRERIQMGIAFRSRTVILPDTVREMAEIINSRLDFLGGWFFQIKQDAVGNYKLMEISCRMAGTMTLHRHKGINFALMGIFELLGIDTSYVELPCDILLDRALEAQYYINYEYKHVYLDYDDTLVKSSTVNSTIIKFLYQCQNRGIKVTLLTRHEGNLYEDLEKSCIHVGLFAEIIHITFEKSKVDFINPDKAIFIDNSFAERKEISDCYGIPVFDVDAVDTLIQK